MIITFPILVDETISNSIIPGVCKILERYCLIYKMDLILKIGGLPTDSRIIDYLSGTPFSLAKDYLLDKIKSEFYIPIREKKDEKTMSEKMKDLIIKLSASKKKDKDDVNKKVEIKTSDIRSNLSIEPTMIVLSSKQGTSILGIKVIPYPIPSELFVRQLMLDNSLKMFDRFLERWERRAARIFYSIMRTTKLPILSNLPLTKDPFKDIIYARSRYADNIYCLLNLASLESDELFSNQGGVDRLIKLGWKNILIADDINKRLLTCMKEDGGLCTSTHYGFLYSALGKEASEVFAKIEDLKKSTSPFFSKSKFSPSRLFGESLANKYKDEYVNLGLPCLNGDCK